MKNIFIKTLLISAFFLQNINFTDSALAKNKCPKGHDKMDAKNCWKIK